MHMLEDELLKLRFKRQDSGALAAIYDKYADYLLTLAGALLNDHALAEDVLHDVFIRFARSVTHFRLRGSLKAYLAKSVINRSRDHIRKRQRHSPEPLDQVQLPPCSNDTPDSGMILAERSALLTDALAQISDEQREVVVLKINGGLKFRQIAAMQQITVNAAQARYRYGIDKLRSILNSEVEK
jgi:RNA polymerase sigma-70 factor (ECF subfamily)